MNDAEKARSMEDFFRSIYPIWRGIEKKDAEHEASLSMDTISRREVLGECMTLHKQDIAIHESGIKPSMAAISSSNEFRRKAAVAEKYNSWKGGE